MAKITKEGEEKEKSTLQKITDFFKGQKKAEEEDADATVAEDEEADAEKADDEDTAAKKEGEDDEEDDDNKDDNGEDDDDVDTDDDDATMEVNGAVINLKNVDETRQAIVDMQGVIAQQSELLRAAAAELGKTKEQVKEEIKSSFVPKGSQRSIKKVGQKEVIPSFSQTKKDSIADRVKHQAVHKMKR